MNKGDIEIIVDGQELQEKLKNKKTYGTKLVDSGGCPALAAPPRQVDNPEPLSSDQTNEKTENLEKPE